MDQSSIPVLEVTDSSNEHVDVTLQVDLALIPLGVDADVVLSQDLLVLSPSCLAERLLAFGNKVRYLVQSASQHGRGIRDGSCRRLS